MLPSAAAFIDPIFSTGFPLTLLGVERLARLLEDGLFAGSSGSGAPGTLDAYATTTLAEADHTARFVGGCYAAFPRFAEFASYSMFYFAVASFEEARRRLRPDGRGFGFLAADDARLAAEVARLTPTRSRPTPRDFAAQVARAIEPLNVAGLCRPEKANWYGVDNDDLTEGAAKLGVSAEAVQRMLTRLGL
jgi:FADH2 O2-dependent halogenase